MSTLDTLIARLQANASLVAAVGVRIRKDEGREKDVYPFLVIKQTVNQIEKGIDGTVHARREVFQIESWDASRGEAFTTHALVEAALQGSDFDVEEADPDAIDPSIGARACIWNAEFWTT